MAELLDCAQAAEAATAAALEVPPPSTALPPALSAGAEGSDASGAAAAKAVYDGVKDVEAGRMDGPQAVDAAPAKAPPAPPSALHRLVANPYVGTFGVLLILCSPLPLLKLTADACWRVAKRMPALLTSRQAWREGARWGGWGFVASPASLLTASAAFVCFGWPTAPANLACPLPTQLLSLPCSLCFPAVPVVQRWPTAWCSTGSSTGWP